MTIIYTNEKSSAAWKIGGRRLHTPPLYEIRRRKSTESCHSFHTITKSAEMKKKRRQKKAAFHYAHHLCPHQSSGALERKSGSISSHENRQKHLVTLHATSRQPASSALHCTHACLGRKSFKINLCLQRNRT